METLLPWSAVWVLQYLWPVLVSTASSLIPVLWTFSVISWQREPWLAWELSLAVYYHYNKIFDPYSNGISGGSKPKSLDSKCSKLRDMVRPKFCGLAQTLNEMKPDMPRIKTPLESEALLSFERVWSLLFEVFLKTLQMQVRFLYSFFPPQILSYLWIIFIDF